MGTGARATTLADFDGDGDLDVATADFVAGTAAPGSPFGAGSALFALVAADFNNDGPAGPRGRRPQRARQPGADPDLDFGDARCRHHVEDLACASAEATLGGVTVVLMLTALLAGYLPARRASRLDPAEVVRAD